MRFLSLILFSLILLQSNLAQAKDKLVATPINSPVKETYLKVRLQGFDSISEVLFKPKSGGSEVSGLVVKEGNTFIGKFKGSYLKPGRYEYRVKIRTASGKSQQDEAASVAFINFEIDSSLGVADPGEEGKKTLGGIDSDSDGVRDDIQRWINEEYLGKESTKKALKQMVVSMNKSLESSNDKSLSNQHSHDIGYAIGCLAWIDRNNFNEIESRIRKNFYNTSLRIKTKMEVDSNFHGQGVGPREKELKTANWNSLCEFEAIKNN